MDPSKFDLPNRRAFLGKSACAAMGFGALADQILTLRTLNAAVPENGDDYKALVCVFLVGGNDANNLIIPRGLPEHAEYAAVREILAIPQEELLEINPGNSDGRLWGLHPEVPELKQLFDEGHAAILANTGTLVEPINRSDYLSGLAKLPEYLFSHSDQANQWQTSVPDQSSRTGWGGRLADLLQTRNNGSISMSISMSGTNTFQVGNEVLQYRLTTGGSIPLSHYRHPDDGNIASKHYRRSRSIDNLLDLAHGNLFEDAYAKIKTRAIENDKVIGDILENISLTTVFNPANPLSTQLELVAKLIGAREQLGMCRQIFFCSVGGWDTHSEQLEPHAALLGGLSESLKEFYDATVELQVQDSVTAFTASDFNRSYLSNGKGSDHGWGSHHFVVGGAVQGGNIYGTMPQLALENAVDSGGGRWIPTTSVDEYSATLAKWFGVENADIDKVVPNIGRFATPDLGFLA